MKLNEILSAQSGWKLLQGDIHTDIKYIRSDSRQIHSNDIFLVASTLNDPKYLSEAKYKGATVCILEGNSQFIELAKSEFPVVVTTNDKPELIQGFIAAQILGYPSRKMKIFAVTGTNGKTTMTYLLKHFGDSLGFKTGIIGTLHAKFGETILETGYTTPDSSTLQEILYRMAQSGVEYVFMEASSHGLKLGRTNGLEIYSGLFTNLTRDHLDFHPSMEDYLKSKFRLFELLESSSHPDRFGVSIADDEGCKDMEKLISEHKVRDRVYFVGKNRDYEYIGEELGINGSKFRFISNKRDSTFSTTILIDTNLLGRFNISNLSLAISAWLIEGISLNQIPNLCNSIPKVPGRFDMYYSKDRQKISIVDYAHTPDALKNILESCKAMNPTQIVCLFGCGGDRDRTKRPEMAKIAEHLSDLVIVTSDNPRTEDPQLIIDEIESGFHPEFKNYLRIQDRRQAIQKGIELLEDGGILVVCGKGHENYQIVGKEKIYFDDGEEVKQAFGQLL